MLRYTYFACIVSLLCERHLPRWVSIVQTRIFCCNISIRHTFYIWRYKTSWTMKRFRKSFRLSPGLWRHIYLLIATDVSKKPSSSAIFQNRGQDDRFQISAARYMRFRKGFRLSPGLWRHVHLLIFSDVSKKPFSSATFKNKRQGERFQISAARYMRTVLFCFITQSLLVISSRRLGTTYRYHLHGSGILYPWRCDPMLTRNVGKKLKLLAT